MNRFDLLVPDGQPVRWALNRLHGTGLGDRVYGPNLTLAVCVRAAEEGLPVYFYGSTEAILAALRENLRVRFPALRVAGTEASRFRQLSPQEKSEVVERIKASGAAIVFVGLGCPRQEVWAYEYRDELSLPVLAVGAAFPFLAQQLPQAPRWMQDFSLEWLFRLLSEPRRLWRRYLLLNPAYAFLVALQAVRLYSFSTEGQSPRSQLSYG